MVDEWVEANQIESLRNLAFHEQIVQFIRERATASSAILEVGGGVGFDLRLFLKGKPQFRTYVFSEIGEAMLRAAAARPVDQRVEFFAVDASHVPFADEQFDFVFMIAALHHFAEINGAVAEFARVLRPGGFIIFGIDPNRRVFAWLKRAAHVSRKLLPKKAHSPADEQAEGFLAADFHQLADRNGLEVWVVQPVWLLAGAVHYGLEFLHRVARRDQRLRLPRAWEIGVLAIDRALLKLPGLRHLSWHYTAILHKPFTRG